MRFFILVITLALLPVMMALHAWLFVEKQLPELKSQVLSALLAEGITSAVVDLRFLDLRIAGDGADPAAVGKARHTIMSLGLLRVVSDDLTVPVSLRARLDKNTLELTGWLPDETEVHHIIQLLEKLRPDLKLNSAGLKASPQVRWLEGAQGPVNMDHPLMKILVEKIKARPWLEIIRDDQGTQMSGLLPANGLRHALLVAIGSGTDATALQETMHSIPAAFAEPTALSAFVKSLFTFQSARAFSVSSDAGPVVQAPATRALEAEWLSLLRNVTGGAKVDLKLDFYPSIYHLPGYIPSSPLDPQALEILNAKLSENLVVFSSNSSQLKPDEQARLAAITPLLLRAGPALQLAIGGHPDPEKDISAEKVLALARARQVHAYLVEQGVPTRDIETLAFDPMTTGRPSAYPKAGTVEILVR